MLVRVCGSGGSDWSDSAAALNDEARHAAAGCVDVADEAAAAPPDDCAADDPHTLAGVYGFTLMSNLRLQYSYVLRLDVLIG